MELEIVEQVKKFNPDDVDGYLAFVAKSRAIFERAFVDLADQPFTHFSDMLKVAPDLIRLRAQESVFTLVARHVKDPTCGRRSAFTRCSSAATRSSPPRSTR